MESTEWLLLHCLLFAEGGKPENPEKNPWSKDGPRTNNKLNPHLMLSRGIEPGPHWWEASALTTASTIKRGSFPSHSSEPFEDQACVGWGEGWERAGDYNIKITESFFISYEN